MSAATPFIASSTSSTSRSPTLSTGSDPNPLSADSKPQPRSRFAWCVTGSGHFLDESMALAARLPNVDLFLSAAGEEVLEIYKLPVESLKPQFRVLRDKTASGVPVGMLYDDVYHTVVVAPATSNTVAKCAFGISDSLPTNMFAQAGKLGIPGIVFACDTEAVVVTRSPHDWVT
ncbi:MAG: dihydromethanopterin reductase, partial [Bacteriovorax sp.]|nr:dihydromethanopterin reductase [Rhizobacter sp.]